MHQARRAKAARSTRHMCRICSPHFVMARQAPFGLSISSGAGSTLVASPLSLWFDMVAASMAARPSTDRPTDVACRAKLWDEFNGLDALGLEQGANAGPNF